MCVHTSVHLPLTAVQKEVCFVSLVSQVRKLRLKGFGVQTRMHMRIYAGACVHFVQV